MGVWEVQAVNIAVDDCGEEAVIDKPERHADSGSVDFSMAHFRCLHTCSVQK